MHCWGRDARFVQRYSFFPCYKVCRTLFGNGSWVFLYVGQRVCLRCTSYGPFGLRCELWNYVPRFYDPRACGWVFWCRVFLCRSGVQRCVLSNRSLPLPNSKGWAMYGFGLCKRVCFRYRRSSRDERRGRLRRHGVRRGYQYERLRCLRGVSKGRFFRGDGGGGFRFLCARQGRGRCRMQRWNGYRWGDRGRDVTF